MFLTKVVKILNRIIYGKYDFNKSNPLGGNGERVDIQLHLNDKIDFTKLDLYQKNHFRRYEFAKDIIRFDDVCGDFACGTGYGSVLLSQKAKKVTGADLNEEVIEQIKIRYQNNKKVEFFHGNILHLNYDAAFDAITSFETLEHLEEHAIESALAIFFKALKPDGKLIFSTPYMQERSEDAMKLGFHLTFYIDEQKIKAWLDKAGFQIDILKYQNYETHAIKNDLVKKEFIICVAKKAA
jgi:2-polyprenyl-3-methyl-5-hydroxy-6-metoxy-1,4-benzoquinol methylase